MRTVTRTRAGGAGAWSPRARPRGSRGGTRWAQAWARAIVGAREARIEKRNGARGPRPGSSTRTLAQGERGEGGEPGRTLNSATCSSVRLAAILCVRGCLVFAGVERGGGGVLGVGVEREEERAERASSLARLQAAHTPTFSPHNTYGLPRLRPGGHHFCGAFCPPQDYQRRVASVEARPRARECGENERGGYWPIPIGGRVAPVPAPPAFLLAPPRPHTPPGWEGTSLGDHLGRQQAPESRVLVQKGTGSFGH